MHWNILDSERKKLLPHLEGFRQELHAYLAGGTALALQIGHRTSLDFDFYTQRGTMRDFIDMYFLLKEFQVSEVFRFTKKKFPPFDPYIGLRALTYFKDADEEKGQTRFTLRKAIRWEEIKKTLRREAERMARKGLHL